MQWFLDMVAAEEAQRRKRVREEEEEAAAASGRASPLSPSRRRVQMRRDNLDFQADWGLGDTSSILPLPLEHDAAREDFVAYEDEAPPHTSLAEAASPPTHILRFGRGQRLVRQPMRGSPQALVSTRRKRNYDL